jgi:hypothetical protein
MCMACEMEAMWFAAMEARARAAAEVGPQATLPALPESAERGRVGEGAAGGTRGVDGEQAARGAGDISRSGLRGAAPEEGRGGTAPPRFACEETQAE